MIPLHLPQTTRHKINNYGTVITNADYQKKIAESKAAKKKKKKLKKTELTEATRKLSSLKRKLISVRKKNGTKEKVKLGGGARGKVFRKRLLDLVKRSSEEESENDHENEIDFSKNEDLLVKDSLDDVNVGKFFAAFWPKPRSYYWARSWQ